MRPPANRNLRGGRLVGLLDGESDMIQPAGRWWMRSLVVAILVGAGLALGTAGAVASPRSVVINAEPISHFDLLDFEKKQFGKLEWVGGLVLSSDAKDFGGISGFSWLEGNRFLAVSDRGKAFSGRLDIDGDGKPVGLSNIRAGYLPDLSDHTVKWKKDSEGLAIVGQQALVSFEGDHRVVAYDLVDGFPAKANPELKLPKSVYQANRGNKGMEAVAVAPARSPHAGSIVVLSEAISGGNVQGWIVNGGKARRFVLPQEEDFLVTDAAFTKSGDLILLERDFSLLGGLFIHLRRILATDLQAGAVTRYETLFHGNLRHELDNMEALAIQPLADGASLLTLVSDDNFNPLQRSLLLQFRLPPAQ